MEIKFIKGNKVALGAFRKTVRKLRVAAYCRVSTDSEDQIKSYNSMIKYYTDLIEKNDEWEFVGIYADKAITGTNVKKRNDFKRLIEDCTNGEIDMIITKSIPRFARNTLDTLKYVRMLKEMNVAVYFEVEKINTLKDGEFLTTILSSVAQQEVENTSAYVKKGLKMKMKRGEMVGSHRCFGYEVDKETRQLKIVEEEATAVRYIFNSYLEGAGGRVIANELNKKGIFTINNVEWSAPTVLGIIKNEKYKGDMLQGKTFTIDPISKRRLHNNGEEDKYYVIDHHEPIVSKEIFDKAQKLRKAKSTKKLANGTDQVVINRRYAFSSMLKCGYCGKNLVRKQWHSNSKYSKAVWYCSEPCRKGVKYCPNAKAISESVLEEAFVESYNRLCDNKQDVLEDLLAKIKTILKKEKIEEAIKQTDESIQKIKVRRNKLLNEYLNGTIPQDIYEENERLLKTTLLNKKNETIYQNEQKKLELHQINELKCMKSDLYDFDTDKNGSPGEDLIVYDKKANVVHAIELKYKLPVDSVNEIRNLKKLLSKAAKQNKDAKKNLTVDNVFEKYFDHKYYKIKPNKIVFFTLTNYSVDYFSNSFILLTQHYKQLLKEEECSKHLEEIFNDKYRGMNLVPRIKFKKINLFGNIIKIPINYAEVPNNN